MAYEYNCTNCGKTGYGSSGSGPMSGSNPPSGWITKWGSTKVFCSNKCKDEYNSRNSSSESSSNSKQKSGGFIASIINDDDDDEKRPKTEAEIAYEIERKRKLDEKRDEQEQKAEIKKEAKILKYKTEGKKFLLFTVEKPILTFFLFFILFPVIFFFIGGITFGPGKHMLLFPVLPMIGFAIMYLRDSMKK